MSDERKDTPKLMDCVSSIVLTKGAPEWILNKVNTSGLAQVVRMK